MQLAPIKNTLTNIMIIILIAPSLGVGMAWLNGELHMWEDIGKALYHGFFLAVCMAFAWVGMASPWAKQLRTLISSIRTEDGQATTETKVLLSADPQKLATASVDATGKIRVEEKPADAPTDPSK